MKKYGKYEKKPEGIPEKQPKVKSALLQTYFTSLLCMVLCVTMFFGTSYAWFTSEVTNTANEIYIGTLDVGVFKQVTSDQGPVLVDLSKDDNKLFDSSIRWEPGYTALETIQIVNEGDLAFKYVLSFTDGVAKDPSNNETDLASVAKYFDVWVYDHYANGNTAPAPASYTDITADGTKWEHAGSLDELLAGKTVLDGVMVSVREEGQEAAVINDGTTDGKATPDAYTIALHMKEEAESTVMGQRISLSVKLVAYQMASENDGFQNDTYDDITAVSNVKALQDALNADSEVLLTSDIEIENVDDRVTMNGGVLDGDGKSITYSGERNSNNNSVGVLTTSGGTIRNLKIDGGENGRALYITKLTSNLYVSDCTLSGAYAFNLNSADSTEYTLNFTNTVFNAWTSYANVMEHAYFIDCTFGSVLKPYGSTTLTNCTFTTEGLDVSALEAGETVTLVNCTYNGQLVENAVLTATADGNGQITVECDNNLLDINEGNVVLNGGNS